MLNCFSHVQLFVILCNVAYQAHLSMGFSRQEYWCGLPCPPPRDLLHPGLEPTSSGRQVLYHWHHLGSPKLIAYNAIHDMSQDSQYISTYIISFHSLSDS